MNDNRHHQQEEEDEDAPPSIIQQIAPTTIRRIVAGQAVTDLSSAVKELVDNSIDANATRINIKLHGQGLDAIEVGDNGCGVPKSSRKLMATKHATSKLREFDDLYRTGCCYKNGNAEDADDANANNAGNDASSSDGIDCAPTLGFRGEALFCLSNLSRSLQVSTRTSDEQAGEQFNFNTDGELIESSITRVPRQVGTTVTVHGLFEAVPVRRVDMAKRIRMQRMKLVKMMQGCEC